MKNGDRLKAISLGLMAALGVGLPAQARDFTIPVINFTDLDLYYLYVSPSDSDDWGEDRLGETTIEALGDYQEITISGPDDTCFYDVQGAFESSDGTLEEGPKVVFWAVNLCELNQQGSIIFFPDDLYHPNDYAADDFIRIINTESNSTLLGLLATPVESASEPMSTDLLGSTYLRPREHLVIPRSEIDPDDTCYYYLQAYFAHGVADVSDSIDERAIAIEELEAVDLCSLNQLLLGEGTVEEIRVENTTDMILAELYISPSSDDDWGIEQLVFELEPGDTDTVFLPVTREADGTCGLYDTLGIFYKYEDGQTSPSTVFYESYEVNLCETSDFILGFSNPDFQYEESPIE